MMGLPPPDTGGCKPKLLVLMGDIIQTLNIYLPSLPLVTERIHSPFQPKQSPSSTLQQYMIRYDISSELIVTIK